jgi:hypothetical protein
VLEGTCRRPVSSTEDKNRPTLPHLRLPHQDKDLTGVRTQDGKFPTSELMSFLRSICMHSRSLRDVFKTVDGAAAPSGADKAPSGAEKGLGTEGGGSSTGRSAGAQDRMERYSMEESSGPENEEDPAVTETDIEHLRLMRLEVQRRRYDNRKGTTTSQKQAQFLKWCVSELASALQPSGKARLAEYIHEFLWNATSPDAVKVCRPFAPMTSLPRQTSPTPPLPWPF